MLFVASASLAGQRTRGDETLRGNGSDNAAAPVVQEIAPGVARAVVNGQALQARRDGYISLEEVVTEYGTPQLYRAAMALSRVRSTQRADGTALYANNVVMSSALVEVSPEQQLEDRKQSARWMSQQVSGSTVTVFVDGSVMSGMDTRVPAMASRNNALKTSDGTRTIWADGAVSNN